MAGLGTGVLFTVDMEVAEPGVEAEEGLTAIIVSAVVLLPSM